MIGFGLVLGIVFFIGYRFMKKRKSTQNKVEVVDFEEDFKNTYGTTWESWVTVKRDMLGDDAAIAAITSVFNDMYRTRQEVYEGAK